MIYFTNIITASIWEWLTPVCPRLVHEQVELSERQSSPRDEPSVPVHPHHLAPTLTEGNIRHWGEGMKDAPQAGKGGHGNLRSG